MSYNSGTYQGRLTADVELREIGQSKKAEFTVACSRSYKNSAGERKTDFIPCEAWRGTAEFIAKYFQKGSPILVQGPLEIEAYEDSEGNKRRAFHIKVENAHFVDGAARPDASDGGSGSSQGAHSASEDEEEEDDDGGDLPF